MPSGTSGMMQSNGSYASACEAAATRDKRCYQASAARKFVRSVAQGGTGFAEKHAGPHPDPICPCWHLPANIWCSGSAVPHAAIRCGILPESRFAASCIHDVS